MTNAVHFYVSGGIRIPPKLKEDIRELIDQKLIDQAIAARDSYVKQTINGLSQLLQTIEQSVTMRDGAVDIVRAPDPHREPIHFDARFELPDPTHYQKIEETLVRAFQVESNRERLFYLDLSSPDDRRTHLVTPS